MNDPLRETIRAIIDREIESAEADYEHSGRIDWLDALGDEIVDAVLAVRAGEQP